jgi:cytochrome c peroxidase
MGTGVLLTVGVAAGVVQLAMPFFAPLALRPSEEPAVVPVAFEVSPRKVAPVTVAAVAPERASDVVELGRRLFFEPGASHSGRHACASCHLPDHAFADKVARSSDEFGQTARATQTLLEVGGTSAFHWDGEFPTIEALVDSRTGETRAGEVRGYQEAPQSFPDVSVTIEARARYGEGFEAAFGTKEATPARVRTAIASYVRSLRATEAPIDRFLAGDETALGEGAKRGLALFRGRAGCVECHRMDGARPTFTDGEFHNTGVAWRNASPPPAEFLARARERVPVVAGRNVALAQDGKDPGRMLRTLRRADLRKFKTPTLRDVARRGPYMHDGSFGTLEDVVHYYVRGGSDDAERDGHVKPFDASAQDVRDLVELLQALNGDERAGLAPSLWSARAPETKLVFLDARKRPVARMPVTIFGAGDELPGYDAKTQPYRTLVTDDQGVVRFAPPLRTHTFVRLPDDVTLPGGAILPDSCREATFHLKKLSGWLAVEVVWPGLEPSPPARVTASIGVPTTSALPERWTLLAKTYVRTEGGRTVVGYGGWPTLETLTSSLRILDPRTRGTEPSLTAVREPGRGCRVGVPG